MKTILCWFLLVVSAAPVDGGQARRLQEGVKKNSLDGRAVPGGIDRRTQSVDQREYAEIFRAVERGILEGNVGVFSTHFGPQVFVSLPGGESGYYSANQAYYVLQNYLSGRRLQSFRFSTFGETGAAPFATGPGRFEARGSVEIVQVYAAVSPAGGRWVLTQVNIY